MISQNKRLILLALSVSLLLLIPFIAMQFSNDVNWKIFDFLIAAILLSGTGLTIEVIMRKIKNRENRMLLLMGSIVILILIWLELAVGIFGSAFAGS